MTNQEILYSTMMSMAQKKRGSRALMFAALASLAGGAQALEFQVGDINVDVDTTLTYSASRRMQDANSQFLHNPADPAETLAVYSQGSQEALQQTIDMQRDDGNRNFGEGLISSKVSFLTDIDINAGDHGLFLRATGLYDTVYEDRSTDNDSLITYNTGAPNAQNLAFPEGTLDQHGSDLEFLDAFYYGDFTIGSKNLNLRIGDQVVSWGEALRIPNGINFANGPADASKLTSPGVELKEVFLPVGSIFGQLELSDTLTLEAYYQYEWEKTRIPGVGSYFSDIDALDVGGDNILIPVSFIAFNGSLAQGAALQGAATTAAGITGLTQMAGLSPFVTLDRAANRGPDDDGQFGTAFRWLAEDLNDTEFGFYYVRYHAKTPSIVFRLGDFSPVASDGTCILPGGTGCGGLAPVPGNDTINWIDQVPPGAELAGMVMNAFDNSEYFLEYVEDINLLGLSASTVINDVTIAGEVSLHEDAPVSIGIEDPLSLIAAGIAAGDAPGTEYQTYTLENIVHWDFSALQVFGPNALSDSAVVFFEVAGDLIPSRDSNEVGNILDPVSSSSWAFTLATDLIYNDVTPGLTLTVPLVYSQGVNGDSPFPAGMKEGRRQASIGLSGQYYENIVGELKYTAFWGDDDRNTLADRDFLSFAVKYSF